MRIVSATAAAWLIAAAPAYSQPAAATSASNVVPPGLVEGAAAEYPAGARDGESVVVLKLGIDVDGRVSEVAVHRSGGATFDEAALAAAWRLRFTPARRGGATIASRILFEYTFRPPARSEPPTTPAEHEPPQRSPVPGPNPPNEPPPSRTDATSFERHERRPGGSAPIEVVVQGQSVGSRLRDSARAILVIDTAEAKKHSGDLGEVLARSPGVAIRRDGGLGSGTRLSLNGLSDDQIRVFLDGVPLELSGYAFGVANVPVNLVERLEVYRGVVPIRFGADALGGAINLATDDNVEDTRVAASYQAGSFGTQRATLGLRTHDVPSGFFLGASAFHDVADNDYPIDVEWPNALGRLEQRRAYRFHDAYRASGANVEAGIVQRPWAKRLLLRLFVTDHFKELQHGAIATIPYGDIESRRTYAGVGGRYSNVFARAFAVEGLAGFTWTTTRFLNPDRCAYDWWAQCVSETQFPDPSDYLTRTSTVFSRLHLAWHLQPGRHTIRLSLAPTLSTIEGDERAGSDPNDGDQRELMTSVGGVEHELALFDGRLKNVAFVKGYLQTVRADKHVGDIVLNRNRDTLRPGVGDSLRYRFAPWLQAKASYEWATRLPNLDEIFGNGVLVLPNLELVPETSHNANLGFLLEVEQRGLGTLALEVNSFLRETQDQVLLLHSQDLSMHENVFSARSVGVEAMGSYSSPGEHLKLTGNVTRLDYRNTSTEGGFANFSGDRIPNRPYFFLNLSARVQIAGVATDADQLALTWFTRYVHQFFRSWESVGQRDLKEVIPSQLQHSIVLVYEARGDAVTLGNSFEIQNLTDRPAYDHFGVQRPGRAFYYKLTAQL